MCHVSAEKETEQANIRCGCGFDSPAMHPVEEGIKNLETHRKILQHRIEMIDTKIAGLKIVKTP
jgi:hypothetical protein